MPVVQRQEERQDDRAAEAVLNQRKTFGENIYITYREARKSGIEIAGVFLTRFGTLFVPLRSSLHGQSWTQAEANGHPHSGRDPERPGQA
jgi:hypothetical protein